MKILKDTTAHDKIVARLMGDWETLKTERSSVDQRREEIGEYIAPSRLNYLSRKPNQLRSDRLTDTTAVIAAERTTALIYGYMMGPYSKWLGAEVEDDNAGVDQDGLVWLDKTPKTMLKFFAGPKTNWRTETASSLQDWVTFGDMTMWSGTATLGGLPRYKATPVLDVWTRRNGVGQVDSYFVRFPLSAHAAVQQYPTPKIKELAGKHPEQIMIFLAVIEPNMKGEIGGVNTNKPYSYYVIDTEHDKLVEWSGYDSLPYASACMHKRSGENYGEGFGARALPIARRLNITQDSLTRGTQLAAEPPIADFTNGALGPLDRRPGAVNKMPIQALGYNAVADAFQQIHLTGDLGISVEKLRMDHEQIYEAFGLDWMIDNPNSGPRQNVPQVHDRQDQRLRAMGPLVAVLEQDFLNHKVERSYTLLQRAKKLRPVPQSLNARELEFIYMGPLANAQKLGEFEALNRVIDFVARAGQAQQAGGAGSDILDFDGMIEDASRMLGAPAQRIRPSEQVKQLRKQRAEQSEDQIETELLQGQAAAAQNGAQALASLSAASAA